MEKNFRRPLWRPSKVYHQLVVRDRANNFNLRRNPVGTSPTGLCAKFISVRRNFYIRLSFGGRCVYECSAGQHHRHRQRSWGWIKTVRYFFCRIRRFNRQVKRPSRPRRPLIRYKKSWLIRMGRYQPPKRFKPWGLVRREERPRLLFVFRRYQPDYRWRLIMRELRNYLKSNRLYLFKVQLKFFQPRPHNGCRLKKPRRK